MRQYPGTSVVLRHRPWSFDAGYEEAILHSQILYRYTGNFRPQCPQPDRSHPGTRQPKVLTMGTPFPPPLSDGLNCKSVCHYSQIGARSEVVFSNPTLHPRKGEYEWFIFHRSGGRQVYSPIDPVRTSVKLGNLSLSCQSTSQWIFRVPCLDFSSSTTSHWV